MLRLLKPSLGSNNSLGPNFFIMQAIMGQVLGGGITRKCSKDCVYAIFGVEAFVTP